MLRDVYKDIVADIKANSSYFDHNDKIFRCMKGDQLSVLKQAFQKVNSPLAKQDKIDLAISIPLIQKIVSKLSLIYTFDVDRNATTNQDLVDYYETKFQIDSVMQNSNELFNGMKSVLVEIYQKKNKELGARPIPSDRFFVWTDDVLEPNLPTVYIKIVGFCKDLKDKKKKNELYFAYTDTEFLAFDSSGAIREEYSTEGDVNDLGVAPFVYINRDIFDILPTPNKDLLQNVIQICSIFTDANVANYYQSFPIRILINADLDQSNIDINPNSVVVLNGKAGSGVTPDFKELTSSLDTSKSINLAKEVLENLLYCLDISAGGVQASGDAKSGLAITLEATDVLENRKKQITFFEPAEKEFWHKLSIIHNTLVKRNYIGEDTPKTTFDKNFQVDVEFELPSTEAEQQKEANGDDSQVTPNASQEDVNASKSATSMEDKTNEEVKS